MRGKLLHSLSTLCIRNQVTGINGVHFGGSFSEPLAVQLSTLTKCFGTYNPTSLASLHIQCNHSADQPGYSSWTWPTGQLTDIKVSNPSTRSLVTSRDRQHHAKLLTICVTMLQLSSVLQGFTSGASRWQADEAQGAGINPLMQTPAPALRGSVFGSPGAESASQERTAQAVLRKTKISPKKLNEFAKLIRRMHIDDALVQCQVAPNKAAKLCYKVCSLRCCSGCCPANFDLSNDC